MEFFASHDLPLCFLPCHSWRYQQHPALSATVLFMFSRCAAPALSLTSSSGRLLAIRTKNTESVRFCSQNTRGTERVKCPVWGCRSPVWNVVLDVRLFWLAVIRAGVFRIYRDRAMSIHRHFPVDRKTVRK